MAKHAWFVGVPKDRHPQAAKHPRLHDRHGSVLGRPYVGGGLRLSFGGGPLWGVLTPFHTTSSRIESVHTFRGRRKRGTSLGFGLVPEFLDQPLACRARVRTGAVVTGLLPGTCAVEATTQTNHVGCAAKTPLHFCSTSVFFL